MHLYKPEIINPMAKFDFYIDQKTTMWERSHFSVVAATEDEAVEIMKRVFSTGDEDIPEGGFSECETLYDTIQYLSPEENDGDATKELWRDSPGKNEMIMDNTPVPAPVTPKPINP